MYVKSNYSLKLPIYQIFSQEYKLIYIMLYLFVVKIYNLISKNIYVFYLFQHPRLQAGSVIREQPWASCTKRRVGRRHQS